MGEHFPKRLFHIEKSRGFLIHAWILPFLKKRKAEQGGQFPVELEWLCVV
jgi:hypothetical protein